MNKPFLADALQEMTSVFEEMLESLSTLQALSHIELEQSDEDALLRDALGALIGNYGLEYGAVFLHRENRLERAATLTWRQLQGGDAGPAWTPGLLEERLTPLAMTTGELQVERLTPGDKENTTAGCLLSAPVTIGGQAAGVLNLGHPDPGFLNHWHQRLIPLFSSFLGQMLTANRLLNHMSEEVQRRTVALEEALDETRRLKRHYKDLALVDELTGLYNRRYFFAEGRQALGRALSVLVLDLDHFKRVNDTYGHAMGDRVLQDVSQGLQTLLREADILARIGGEEFGIILPETDAQGAREVAERLLAAVNGLGWQQQGEVFAVSTSIGMASLAATGHPADGAGNDPGTLLDRLVSGADRAMYQAKQDGGNRAEISPSGIC